MTRWLVTGAGGLLGREVVARLGAVGLVRAELDVTSDSAVRSAFDAHRPDVVVNCAAWTNVDTAETHPAEASLVNAEGPRVLASASAEVGARLLHISTDYVFAGSADSPYSEADPTGPVNHYGRTKLAGEHAVLAHGGTVVRTAWLFSADGANFVTAMIQQEREREYLDVVADKRGQPTWTRDVVDHLSAAADYGPGVVHLTNAGDATRHEQAQEVFRLLGKDPERVRPISSSDTPDRAPRPTYTVLANHRLPPLPHWREALRAVVYSLGV
ncbi:dTDP-4-dehydrorhamnose reductase [Tenggerimyces flavus]|uniref:dTDP-4-dehydrorhamnose reductase n=1 Tax=Tenggerimyces flavus TaxID=1708749 RepID=A0ABV7YCV3_9ACTN|nr:dTDP-4-dehydrorhamnose reductase [Tenggerimyces flavus]MBM7786969.1 dTDP-4-dehydrorhamnose reductase [Tenggerimyces flavus]